jgi:hypothetical protein
VEEAGARRCWRCRCPGPTAGARRRSRWRSGPGGAVFFRARTMRPVHVEVEEAGVAGVEAARGRRGASCHNPAPPRVETQIGYICLLKLVQSAAHRQCRLLSAWQSSRPKLVMAMPPRSGSTFFLACTQLVKEKFGILLLSYNAILSFNKTKKGMQQKHPQSAAGGEPGWCQET